MDMLSTLESLTEWRKPFTGVKGTFHYLMAAVNRNVTNPFSHHPYVAPVLLAIPAGD